MKVLTFDRVLNVALLAAVLYGVVAIRLASRPALTAYERGETAPAIAGVSYGAAKRTAVLFVRSTCHFCTESMSFYQELVKDGRQVVAISGEPRDRLDAYLTENGLAIRSATITRGEWPKLVGTPTIVVVDASGRVVKSWAGLLSPHDQQNVRESLN